MKTPAAFAHDAEDHPRLPRGAGEKLSGYGVMGLPFRSGHVLGLRRWTASSAGAGFTSIWHRNPEGSWTFYESAPCEIACSRYFGNAVDNIRVGPISLVWEGPTRLHVRTVDDAAVDWTIDLASSPVTRLMSSVGSLLPRAAWRSPTVLRAMGRMAGTALRVGTVRLTGDTANRQHFDANPLRIWHVERSSAAVNAEPLGPVGPLAEQARMADFYFPQRGIFAVGRVFVTTDSATGERSSVSHSTG